MRDRIPLAPLVLALSACGGGTEQNPFDETASPCEEFEPAGEKPTEVPAFASIGLYSSDSPWNTPLDPDAPLDPESDSYVDALVGVSGGAGLGVVLRQFSSTVFVADGATPRVDVRIPCGIYWEIGVDRLTDVPIPLFADPTCDYEGEVDPVGCGEDSDQDNHMIVLDLENRCEYDFWQMRFDGESWTASWANAISLDSNGVYPSGISTRGSGFAFLGGVIWPDEIASGEIRHALALNYPITRSGGPVAPATDSDGVTDRDDALPEGARLRLDPSLDLDELGLSEAEATVALALQVWGAYLVDTGGEQGVFLYAIDPESASVDAWGELLGPGDYPELPNIPLDRLQVLELGPQDTDWRDSLGVTDTGCNHFE